MTIKRRIKRRIEFSVETDEVVIVARGAGLNQAFCDHCRTHVTVLTADEAAARVRVPSRTVHQWLAERKLHCLKMDNGAIGICLASLQALASDE